MGVGHLSFSRLRKNVLSLVVIVVIVLSVLIYSTGFVLGWAAAPEPWTHIDKIRLSQRLVATVFGLVVCGMSFWAIIYPMESSSWKHESFWDQTEIFHLGTYGRLNVVVAMTLGYYLCNLAVIMYFPEIRRENPVTIAVQTGMIVIMPFLLSAEFSVYTFVCLLLCEGATPIINFDYIYTRLIGSKSSAFYPRLLQAQVIAGLFRLGFSAWVINHYIRVRDCCWAAEQHWLSVGFYIILFLHCLYQIYQFRLILAKFGQA